MGKNTSPEEQSLTESREQQVAIARKFNLLSNVFMSVALRDKRACQYVLRILTGIDDLVVKEVRTQYHISKLHSHDAILDVLAEDRAGNLYNIEIQRTDTIDHGRRVRFYAASIDGEYLAKGKTYAELPEVFTIYISETDLWKAGQTVYQVEKHFKNTDIPYDDGLHIIYVNAAVNDGSAIADLMQYFKSSSPDDMRHGDLSERVRFLKCEEGGFQEMCEVSEQLINLGEARGLEKGEAIGIKKGEAIGIKKGKLELAKETAFRLADFGMSAEKIAEMVQISKSTVKDWLDNRPPTMC